MPHAYFWPIPENKDKLSLNDYAKHKIDTKCGVSGGEGPTVDASASSEPGSDPSVMWEFEGKENGMFFNLELSTMMNAFRTSLNFDRFKELQDHIAASLKHPDLPGLERLLYEHSTPEEDAAREILTIEKLQEAFRQLADDLEGEKERYQKFIQDTEARKRRSELRLVASQDEPHN